MCTDRCMGLQATYGCWAACYTESTAFHNCALINLMEHGPSCEASSCWASWGIPRICKTWRFISIALSTTCESSLRRPILFLARQFQYDSPVNVWIFQVVSFPHISPTKQYMFLICTLHARCLAQLIVLGLITQFFNDVYKCNSWSSWLCTFSPNSCYLLQRRSGYFPQHPVLEHTPSQFERLVSSTFKTSGKNLFCMF